MVNVARAEAGAIGAVAGTLETAPSARLGQGFGSGAIEVAGSRDGRFAFVSVEYPGWVAVYNLRAALAGRFKRSSYVGALRLGGAVVGLAVSPNGRWLYATSELAAGARSLSRPGTLSVIDIAEAERDPSRSVVATVEAGCQPVRVVASANGATVWVTARASDDLLAFSASKLTHDPAHALLAAIRVGEAPVGLALVRHDTRVVVADSNRSNAPGGASALTVVDASAALAGRPAVLGAIAAGSFPREMSLAAGGRTLLVGNFASGQLEAIRVSELP